METEAASTMSIHRESVGICAVATVSVAEAGPPAVTPVPVTDEVVLRMEPGIVACMSIGTLQEAPAPNVTLESAHPEPVNTALPAPHV